VVICLTKKTKRQHYVPRCFLEKFTDNNQECHVFNKETQSFFHCIPEKILAQGYYYDINFCDILEKIRVEYSKNFEGGVPDEQILEKIFSSIENNYSHIQKELSRNSRWLYLITNNYLLYQLVAVQLERIDLGKKILMKYNEEIFQKQIGEEFSNVLLLNEIISIVKGNGNSLMLRYLFGEYGRAIILTNNSDISFLTGDITMVRIDKFKDFIGEVLYYPITPNKAV